MNAVAFLVFLACAGTECHEVNGGRFDSMIACIAGAQPLVARWLEEHPAYDEAKEMTCGSEPADEGTDL